MKQPAHQSKNDTPPRDWIRRVQRVVVKIGSRALVDEQHHLDLAQLEALAGQMAALQQSGRQVICVSSGAVAAGLRELGLDDRPVDLPSLQAAAAVGQARLIELYRTTFAAHGCRTAQVLLTHPDLRSRERHLNARNTLHRLLDASVIPIVNENDTVSVDEIRFGDNDRLSALVANLVHAELLVLLTAADGLLTAPPEAGGELIAAVDEISDETFALAGGAGSSVSTGGMRSKLQAAQLVMRTGEWAIIANARCPDILGRLFAGEALGTVFTPRPQRMRGRKRWIAHFEHPAGDVHVDAGAAGALVQRGASLLAAGITAVHGEFHRGASVRIIDPSSREIARGLVNYTAHDLRRIIGCKSDEIADVLGTCEFPEVIHRDNLALA